MAGSYLDYEKLLSNGIPGLKHMAAEYEAKTRSQGSDAVLKKITVDKPETMREAIQLMWLYILISGTVMFTA